MSVRIQGLTKIFGVQRAVNNISFEAPEGRITGFLGPNGAGKSTTMRLATGYLQPTSGAILLNGINVFEEPQEARQVTGYLPEHNPLYTDMYIREFLRFIGRAYGLRKLKQRVEEMVVLCGLTREHNKKIGTLSKGYRQRVGLAAALIHDPKVLILDEPTSGLDPNQIIEIRKVIKSISGDKTVILSTHIMQEVEAVCDKVVIINKGEIVADDELSVLKEGKSGDEGFIVHFESEINKSLFIEAGFNVTGYEKNAYLISSDHQTDIRADLLKITSDHHLPLVSLTKAHHSLEEIFHRLTQSEN